jgi:hypothetical protein
MVHIKNFKNFLNESKLQKLPFVEPKTYATIKGIVRSGKIYGQKILSYPFVLAVSGTGDDYGNDEAWLINNQEDLIRWVTSDLTGNKMFPSIENMDEDDLEDELNKESDMDDFSNGYRVQFFKNEAEMKDAIKASRDEYGDPDDLDSSEMYNRIIDGDYFPARKLTKKW